MTLNSKLFRDRKALKQKALPSKQQRKLPDRLSPFVNGFEDPVDPTTGSFYFVAALHTAMERSIRHSHFCA